MAWTFTSYHAILKRGALEKDLAAVFFRVVLFLSNLFQITGRIFILVLFAFAFARENDLDIPGKYESSGFWPLLVFMVAHIVIMTICHYIFSDAKLYWEKSGCSKLNFFHYMFGNGLANIYIHNWIRMDPLLIEGIYVFLVGKNSILDHSGTLGN